MKENKHAVQAPQEGDEGFLSRWSRLKSQAKVEEVEAVAQEYAEAEAQAPAAVEEVYQPTDEDMPPLETLDESSDYSGFMSPRVSEELRRLALRKLFQTPSFHVRDGLDDYDDDFTRFTPLGDTITSDMRFQQEMEALKQRAAEEQVQNSPGEALAPHTEAAHDDSPPAASADASDVDVLTDITAEATDSAIAQASVEPASRKLSDNTTQRDV